MMKEKKKVAAFADGDENESENGMEEKENG